MGESSIPVDAPQPKPSRFQFVPVPGEFTRGRWKCRDTVKPYAELLEFDKSGKEDKPNPNKITVTRKFVKSIVSDTIQVTSIENNTRDSVEEPVENVLITRKKGVTIVRKVSGSLTPEKDVKDATYATLHEISIDDFEKDLKLQQQKTNMVPPTPMNTPPASMSDSMIASKSLISEDFSNNAPNTATPSVSKPKTFQIQAVKDSSIAQPTRKFSHENGALQHPPDSSQFANIDATSSSYSATLPPQKPRVFHVQPVQDSSMETERTKSVVSCAHFTITNQCEIDGVFDLCPPKRRESEETEDIEIRTVHLAGSESKTSQFDGSEGVSITISSMVDKKENLDTEIIASKREIASSVSSLDTAGIPIASSTPIAPHSTPYGTPKETLQRSPIEPPVFTATVPNTVVSAPNLTSGPATVTEVSAMPIDNKIEQAMELVKTHLTYAVREEVDTLKNTITDLEYQMRESQYETNFLRQHVSQEILDQAAAYVRQQMQKFQPPARRSMSLAGCTSDGAASSASVSNTGTSSTHMRNLQNQIQQIKVSHPSASSHNVLNSHTLS